jgi:hypothetical protein
MICIYILSFQDVRGGLVFPMKGLSLHWFVALGLAFPPDFQQAQFVLNALAQWQFRPAAQNGQIEKVEVLLIIPEELE